MTVQKTAFLDSQCLRLSDEKTTNMTRIIMPFLYKASSSLDRYQSTVSSNTEAVSTRMKMRLGATIPNFSANTTQGPIKFHEWQGDS
jgi:hypothetical protein